MNNVWRRHLLNNFSNFNQMQYEEQKSKEATYLQDLSKYLKVLKKKQDLYFRLCDIQKRNEEKIDMQIHTNIIHKELDRLKIQQSIYVKTFENLSDIAYMSSKMALFSFYNRINQILEITKQRLKMLDPKFSNFIQIQKKNLNELYNNQIYLTNYNVLSLIELATTNSTKRLTNQIQQVTKNLRVDSMTQLTKSIGKRSMSQINVKPFKTTMSHFLQILNDRKLKTKQQSTEKYKIIQRQKKQKKKSKPDKVFAKLYGYLDVKNIFYEQLYQQATTNKEFTEGIQISLNQRNGNSFQTIQKYTQDYLIYKKRKQQRNYRIRNRKKQQKIDKESTTEDINNALSYAKLLQKKLTC